ncbi:prolyl-tRNA synthetase [Clostridiales bacterium S5-A14a]|nr:prolyl-tRNA synthetase [Clostridiales bacterium S5-A14a]
MKKSKDKTNVMRILDSKNIEYKCYSYEADATLTGVDVAHRLNKDENTVFKTLVTVGKSKEHYVFVIPVNKELDLKKASKAVSEKNISMLKSRDLLALTGYIHGGCSPIGMKKPFKTVFHYTISNLYTITFSAGKIGYQVELKNEDIAKVIKYNTADICIEN